MLGNYDRGGFLPAVWTNEPSSAVPSGVVPDGNLHIQASGRSHVDQCVQAEQVNFATHEIGYPKLRRAKESGRLRLTQALLLDFIRERVHEVRAKPHVPSHGRTVFNRLPYVAKDQFPSADVLCESAMADQTSMTAGRNSTSSWSARAAWRCALGAQPRLAEGVVAPRIEVTLHWTGFP